jgi:hypothetical protein
MQLINQAGYLISRGMVLEPGSILSDFLSPGYDAAVIESRNGLRLILSDPNGELDPDRMAPDYASQYEGLLEF